VSSALNSIARTADQLELVLHFCLRGRYLGVAPCLSFSELLLVSLFSSRFLLVFFASVRIGFSFFRGHHPHPDRCYSPQGWSPRSPSVKISPVALLSCSIGVCCTDETLSIYELKNKSRACMLATFARGSFSAAFCGLVLSRMVAGLWSRSRIHRVWSLLHHFTRLDGVRAL
jgi:hypothetical protein